MHDLILNGEIIKSHDFKSEMPSILSPNKGKWLPRVIIIQDHDPTTQKLVIEKTVTETKSVWTHKAVMLTQQELDSIAVQKAIEAARLQLETDYEMLKESMKDKTPTVEELFLRIQFIEKILGI